ncbi:hypothetical protein GJ496_005312 [Pomphorhynchus laevis]|nr:hypothetical protein GJ496_005312 [Pomphorhynchus laevis]
MSSLQHSTNSDSDILSEQIVMLCSRFRNAGVTDKILTGTFPNVPKNVFVNVLNQLLSSGKIELLKNQEGLVYKLKSEKSSNVKGSTQEETMILQTINDVGTTGISNKDLKDKTGIAIPLINRILKALEEKRLVIGYPIPGAPRKKLFVAKGVQLKNLSGAFYSQSGFDKDLVTNVQDAIYSYTIQKDQDQATTAGNSTTNVPKIVSVSLDELHDHVSSLFTGRQSLNRQELEKLVRSLIYQQKLEALADDTFTLYRSMIADNSKSDFLRAPCAVCPLFSKCNLRKGKIRPSTCVYMQQWLNEL